MSTALLVFPLLFAAAFVIGLWLVLDVLNRKKTLLSHRLDPWSRIQVTAGITLVILSLLAFAAASLLVTLTTLTGGI